MKKIFHATLSKAINRYLRLDPESYLQLKELQGHLLGIELLPFSIMLYLQFNERGIVGLDETTETPDLIIRGTPWQLLNVARDKKNRAQLFADEIKVEGDALLGQKVMTLFDELDIDWEEQVARLTGDVSAHKIGGMIRGVQQWFKKADASLTADITDYLHEESGWLPAREALQDFFMDIDTLRMDVDRLDAKMQMLRNSHENEDAS